MNTCLGNTKITSYFSFWKLDYFSDMVFLKNVYDTRKILDKRFMFFFLCPANHIGFFYVIWKPDVDPGCILLNINPIPIGGNSNQSLPSMSVLYNGKNLCTKIVVARLQSSGLRLNHGNIAFIKTTHVTKIQWIVLSWICKKYVPRHHYWLNFYPVMT